MSDTKMYEMKTEEIYFDLVKIVDLISLRIKRVCQLWTPS